MKSPDVPTHDALRGVVKSFDPLALENAKRLYFAIDDPPAELVEEIHRLGAKLVEDQSYDLDDPTDPEAAPGGEE